MNQPGNPYSLVLCYIEILFLEQVNVGGGVVRFLANSNLKVNKPFMELAKRTKGFTLVEIMLVVSVIALLVLLAAVNYFRAGRSAGKSICQANLTQIEGAKNQWAMENNRASTDIPADSDLFGPNLYLKVKPQCPSGGIYSLNQVDSHPTCSIANPAHRLD